MEDSVETQEELPASCASSCKHYGYEWDGKIKHILRTPPWVDTKHLKVGDLITGYYKGYWRILSITERPEPYLAKNLVSLGDNKVTCEIGTYHSAPIVVAIKVLNANGTKARKEIKSFDWAYAQKVTAEAVQKIGDEFLSMREAILKVTHEFLESQK